MDSIALTSNKGSKKGGGKEMERGPPHYSTTKPRHYKKKGGENMKITLRNPDYYDYIVTFNDEENENLMFVYNILRDILISIKPMENRIRESGSLRPEDLEHAKNAIEILFKSGGISFEIDNPEE